MVPHYSFNWHCSEDWQHWESFHELGDHLYILFFELSYSLPIFNEVVDFLWLVLAWYIFSNLLVLTLFLSLYLKCVFYRECIVEHCFLYSLEIHILSAVLYHEYYCIWQNERVYILLVIYFLYVLSILCLLFNFFLTSFELIEYFYYCSVLFLNYILFLLF